MTVDDKLVFIILEMQCQQSDFGILHNWIMQYDEGY